MMVPLSDGIRRAGNEKDMSANAIPTPAVHPLDQATAAPAKAKGDGARLDDRAMLRPSANLTVGLHQPKAAINWADIPADAPTGSFIACYWFMKDSVEDHFKCSFGAVPNLVAACRMNPHRQHRYTPHHGCTGHPAPGGNPPRETQCGGRVHRRRVEACGPVRDADIK